MNAREWLDFATERVPQMQETKMKEGRGVGLQMVFSEGEQNIADPEKRSDATPRVFIGEARSEPAGDREAVVPNKL